MPPAKTVTDVATSKANPAALMVPEALTLAAKPFAVSVVDVFAPTKTSSAAVGTAAQLQLPDVLKSVLNAPVKLQVAAAAGFAKSMLPKNAALNRSEKLPTTRLRNRDARERTTR